MDRGVLQSSLVQQIMGESLGWWNTNNLRQHNEQQASSLLPSSSSSSSPTSSGLQLYPQPSNFLHMSSWHDNQDVPLSWSQLLLGGFPGDQEERSSFPFLQAKKMDNWRDDQLGCLSTSGHMLGVVKQETSEIGHVYGHGSGENQAVRSFWSQILPTSSPSSCVTTSSNSSMLEFSNSKSETMQPQRDHSFECNSIESGSASKKARVQASSAHSPFKVRKEKLGDRITALHQLVSPFGKTDTASVLQEAIGYIRFLHSQVEVLSTPYLGNGSGDMRQYVEGERNCRNPQEPCQEVGDEPKKDLRSRGLCLVPVSCTSNVCSFNGADYWAPALGPI